MSTGADGIPFHYIAMELIRGETLRDKLLSGTPVSQLMQWLAQVADGLANAHAAGLVHRDLKPENVMISEDGFAKIVDFGLAKLFAPAVKTPDAPTGEFLTEHGMVVGTIGYIAPEQIEGSAADHRADMFAFGCILYESVTGRRPFEGRSPIETLHKILHEDPMPPQQVQCLREMGGGKVRVGCQRPRPKLPSARLVAFLAGGGQVSHRLRLHAPVVPPLAPQLLVHRNSVRSGRLRSAADRLRVPHRRSDHRRHDRHDPR